MHFSEIYIQKNFVPDIVSDPFGREVIGTTVCFEKGESIDDAVVEAKKFINEYIQRNTVNPHGHIQERYIPESNHAFTNTNGIDPQVREPTLAEQIASCMDKKVLESYKFIAKKDPELQLEYDKRMFILTH